ncbi:MULTISPECIES: hypothetical protein [Pseudoalteromonas]|uniref:Lipoprotein n=1 Tax=Pseudoalteromonas fuliginea TaxID=1872678 RepID=A0ABQ6RKY9_9GAMM|nr:MULTISPECIES: hypothetical protein [Pseudoalteromonas]ATG79923.1 hypothetical protein AOR04_20550 [Pseudoalteromonas sp. 1_2015MBL_MicDiv]KAA1161191.1 hypothetical protein EU509_05355 [Pseudoalteromonas fuliginea]KAA1168293.1 hypothetical protein EUZ79_05700 [Pseudoalteromonas fuliginea]MDQ2042553.1 hypothetical protein [Pseudoalteromonas sp. 20-92]
MKQVYLLILVCLSFVTGCQNFPIKIDIKDNHFRFENFAFDKGKKREYVFLMCNNKLPTDWHQARQYERGEHILWVKAVIGDRDFQSSIKNAFVKFKVNLKSGGRYILNRKIDGNNVFIWIEDETTREIVSDIKKSKLKKPLIIEGRLREKQCFEGSI